MLQLVLEGNTLGLCPSCIHSPSPSLLLLLTPQGNPEEKTFEFYLEGFCPPEQHLEVINYANKIHSLYK